MKSETKELTLPERAAVALGTAEHEKTLIELSKKYTDIVEIKDSAGREQTHGAYMTLKNARISIEKAGKAAREDATAFSKAVIAEEKRLSVITGPEEIRLMTLRDDWDAARATEKEAIRVAEIKRVQTIREWIDEFRGAPARVGFGKAIEIEEHAADLQRVVIEEDRFCEFTQEATDVRDAAVRKLCELADKAREHEREQERIAAERAELARLRAEQEAREHVAAMERAAAEEEARKEREAEQRKLDEQRAELARQQAEIDKANADRQWQEFEARKKAEAAERAEKQRIADEKAAEAARLEPERRAAEAEKTRRERVKFEEVGPGALYIVSSLASEYGVDDAVALRWLMKIQWHNVTVEA